MIQHLESQLLFRVYLLGLSVYSQPHWSQGTVPHHITPNQAISKPSPSYTVSFMLTKSSAGLTILF